MESCEGNNTSFDLQEKSNASSVLTDYIQKQLEGVSCEIDKIVDYRKIEVKNHLNCLISVCFSASGDEKAYHIDLKITNIFQYLEGS